ncbi:MAG: hypothetical protein HYX53_16400 [Chloroflexi bacterium]|nr:hypothetical protein [Chloroflexota bacterium]
MGARIESKWQEYFHPKEFERGRAKMWEDGWIVVEKRTRPGKLPVNGGGGGGTLASGFVEISFALLTWLVNKKRPERILMVRYERPNGR